MREGKRLLSRNPPVDPAPSDLNGRFSIGMIGLTCIVLILIIIASCSHPRQAIAEEIDLKAISFIESSDEPLAYNNGHYGEYQISEGVLYDYFNNALTGVLVMYTNQLFDEKTSKVVANWYINTRIPELLKHYNIPDNTTSRIIAWNWGIGHIRHWFHKGCHWNKLPRETREYIFKYQKFENNHDFNNND